LKIKDNIGVTKTSFDIRKEEDLKLYRRLLLLTMVLYPFFGYINTFIANPAEESISQFIQRIVFGLLIAIFVTLSYYNNQIKERFYIVISCFIYLGFSHLSFIALQNGFTLNHILGMLMVYVGTSLVFRKHLHLNLYIVYAVILSSSIAYLAPQGDVSSVIVVSIFAAISMVLFVGMNMKIKAEIRLKHNQANFVAITENTNDLIWSVDKSFRFLNLNSVAFDLFDAMGIYKKEKSFEKIDLDVLPETLKNEWLVLYNRAFSGEIFSAVMINYFNNRTYEHSFYPIKSATGYVKGTCVFSRNITDKIDKELKLVEAQKIAKVGSFSRNFVSGEYVWSEYMFELFQLSNTLDVKQIDMKDYIHPEDYEKYSSVFRSQIDKGENFSIRYRIVRPNKTYLHVLSNVIVRKDKEGRLVEVSGTIQDYSEQYRADLLERTNLELHKEKELALQMSKQHEEFLAGMSHEIRTPMNTIVGLSNLFAKTTLLDEKQQEYIQAIQLNSKRLLGIINDVLDYTNLDVEDFEPNLIEFNSKEIVHSLIKSFKSDANKKGVLFESFIADSVPEILYGDAMRISQVLSNLLSNSIKFTHNGKIVLSLEIEENKNVVFKVVDTGVGIPEDKKEKVFETFVQLNASATNKISGTGLGLPISKKIVNLLGGKIILNSWEGIGTEFLVYIPISIPLKEVEGNTEINTLVNMNSYRILLVEDNAFNQMVAIETLESWNENLVIEKAENGEEAIDRLRQNDYDIILMDIQMPVMDGHQATIKIRNEFELPKSKTPILAVTAHAFKEEIDKCFKNGMDDYISKPYEGDELISKILRLVGQKKQVAPLNTSTKQDQKSEVLDSNKDEIVNTQAIIDFTKGKADRIHKMVSMFLNDTPNEITKMKRHFLEGEAQLLRTLAHSFKPKFTYLGMPQLSELAKTIEHRANDGVLDEETSMLIEELAFETEKAYEELNNFLETI
jgi:signal transduction histidine kinase/CheY-like chemotaxis protein/HPt (histidine-containing phosphotransfer) domain-containing protein